MVFDFSVGWVLLAFVALRVLAGLFYGLVVCFAFCLFVGGFCLFVFWVFSLFCGVLVFCFQTLGFGFWDGFSVVVSGFGFLCSGF